MQRAQVLHAQLAQRQPITPKASCFARAVLPFNPFLASVPTSTPSRSARMFKLVLKYGNTSQDRRPREQQGAERVARRTRKADLALYLRITPRKAHCTASRQR